MAWLLFRTVTRPLQAGWFWPFRRFSGERGIRAAGHPVNGTEIGQLAQSWQTMQAILSKSYRIRCAESRLRHMVQLVLPLTNLP